MLRTAVLAVCVFLLEPAYPQQARLGRIDFPTSQSGDAQTRFVRGVLLLHSFQYREAREEFRAAQKLAPAFAMAYWGEAMTYNEPLWLAQDTSAARAVLKRFEAIRKNAKSTEREDAYIDAVRILYGTSRKEDRDFEYATAMRRLHERFPNDKEAAAFYALSLIGTAHRGRDFRTYMQAAAIVEDILTDSPEHPGALHYAIHCYDDPVHAPLGLRAARVYARIAPASSHALHMPSHIFFAMGMWADAARSNEASFQASQSSAARTGEPMEAAGHHALWWLQYAYLQQGRYAKAWQTLSEMEKLAKAQPTPITQFHLIQMQAMYSIETGEAYASSDNAAAHHLASGLSALNRGDRDAAERAMTALESLQAPSRTSAHADHLHPGDAQAVSVMENELRAMLLMVDGKSREAIDRMKAAVEMEDRTPYEFGPPSPPKPAHELMGELLLRLDQPKLARVQFELALRRAPKRALSMLGLARSLTAMGNRAAARTAYSELRLMWAEADPPLLKALDSVARLDAPRK